MNPRYLEIIGGKLALRQNEGPSKVMPLAEAIAKNVRAGMTLHFAVTHCRPNAVSDEIVRQFRGRNPGFSFAMIGLVANQLALVHEGLLKKAIGTFFGDSYPTPGPNRIVQKAFAEGKVEFQNLSILTFPLRLLAGAMGVPWMPTKSIGDSSMAIDNRDYAEIDDPDCNGKKIGMVRALNPDVSFYHAWCADEAGNVLMTPPYGENVFGALAAKSGVIATVEKIVSTEFIRKHAHLVKIPGYLVKAVCVVPMGAHPSGLTNIGVPMFDAYAEDYDFVEGVRNASKKDDAFDEWIKRWILDCPSREDYLAKLGRDKIFFLRGKSSPESWREEVEYYSDKLSESPKANATERMIIAASRKLAQIIETRGYKTILAGVGASNLAAWLATVECKNKNVEVECMAELGFYGYMPRPADPYIFNHRNVHTCKMLAGIDTVMGMLMGGATNKCIGVLGAAQVDASGNVNSTCIPEAKMFLVGSGGANDVASSASEVMVCIEQDAKRFVEKVSYITSPGKSVRTVVTDLGIWERSDADKNFVLSTILDDGSGRSAEDRITEIKSKTGYSVNVSPELKFEPVPTPDELFTLRLYDPKRQFIGREPSL